MARAKRGASAEPAAQPEAFERARVLEARARALASRATVARAASPDRQLMVFRIGEGLYGLPLEAAARTVPVRRLGVAPGPAAFLGLTAEGGRMRPVFDLPALLGLAPPPAGDLPEGYLVILRAPSSAALRIAEAPTAAAARAQEDAEPDRLRLVDGPDAGRTLVLLSPDRLISALESAPAGA